MSANFFAALDDSDNEAEAPAKVVKKVEKKAPVKPGAVDANKEKRRPNNNDRNTKHGRGGRAPTRDGKRAYDRRSGTGRGKEIKKGGGGARNWGSDKNEARKNQGAIVEGATATDGAAAGAGATDQKEDRAPAPVVVEEEEEPEPEDVTVSYEEYIKTKALPDNKAFAPKAARSMEANNEFSNVTAKVAVEEDFLVMGGREGGRKKKVTNKPVGEKLDLGFRVARPDTGGDRDNRREGGRGSGGRGDRDGGRGGGRGGRGSGRGGGRGGRDGRGRGGRDGGRGNSNKGGRGRGGREINTLDASAFPSL